MKTLEYLRDYPDLFWPACLAAVALALLCSMLSVLVVLKRMAFIGQGISHAGFGGIGLAAVFGLASASLSPGATIAQFVVVLAFCIASALGVGILSSPQKQGETHEDTAIGIVLVLSMAIGSVLVGIYSPRFQWESFLFGYLLNTGWADAWVAVGVSAGVLGALFWARRPLAFWAFDPRAAEAFGVRTGAVRVLLLVLLAVATVTAMRLAGVVLASALLILPGAASLKLSSRFGVVMGLSVACAVAGVLAGLVLSFETNWPPGPSIVFALTAVYLASSVAGRVAAAPTVEGVVR